MEVLIDTNVVRVWSGLTQDRRLLSSDLDDLLTHGHTILVPSGVLYEIIDQHFRRDPGKPYGRVARKRKRRQLQVILSLLQKASVAQQPYTPLPLHFIERLISAKRHDEVRDIYQLVRMLRLVVEHEVLTMILTVALHASMNGMLVQYSVAMSAQNSHGFYAQVLSDFQNTVDLVEEGLLHVMIRGYCTGAYNKSIRRMVDRAFLAAFVRTITKAYLLIHDALDRDPRKIAAALRWTPE
jgi:hypothetical protein